jgi:hypothetical protein
MKFQANVPFKLTRLFYEKLGEQPTDKRILVIRELFTAMHASIDNAVTFVTDDKEACELFNKNVVSNDEFGNNDTAIFVDTEINKHAWKDFIKELSNMPKFDVAIMNPPYNTPLCYDIYENVRCKANESVYIGPIQTVYTSLLSDSNCKFYSTSITHMPSRKMNELFNIGIRMECGIVYANKSATTNIEQYKKFWPAMKLFKSIRAKIHNKLNSYLENEPKGKFHIRVFDGCKWDPMNGGAALDYKYAIKDNKVGHVKYVNLFNSENERRNFYDTCNNSIFTKFLMKFTNRKDIPYMQDYTQPWDDKRFCEYFGITGYISDTEAEPNSEWEIILNTMK